MDECKQRAGQENWAMLKYNALKFVISIPAEFGWKVEFAIHSKQ